MSVYVYLHHEPKKIGKVTNPANLGAASVCVFYDGVTDKYEKKIEVTWTDGRTTWHSWTELMSMEANIAKHQKTVDNHTKRLEAAKKYFGEI